jgi:trigger factor
VKVTTEKLPKSLLALDIQLEREQVEKGLDRAARRLSQKANIPGFRKGKAPRFIIENYFGRAALIEEASEDLINKAFKEALQQTGVDPIGRANLEEVAFAEEPFRFRVTVPVAPTIALPDYRTIRAPLDISEVTDEMVEHAMATRRERHVVLQEPEEQRPAQEGDQLTVQLESFLDGEPLEERAEDAEIPESTLILEPDRLVPGLYEGLLGIVPDETRELTLHMPEEHTNEQVRGKDVLFKVKLLRLQQRLLPDWDEVPLLEEFEGTLDELRAKTRAELEESAREAAEQATADAYVKELVGQMTYDLPDALIAQEADYMLHQQAVEFERYGITLEQMLQFRGKKHDEAVEELKPQAEERLKTMLTLQEIFKNESLVVEDAEVDAEVDRMVGLYEEEQREQARVLLATQLRSTVTSSVIDRKLRERLVAIATGEAPALELAAPAADSDDTPAHDEPALLTDASSDDAADDADDATTAHDEPAADAADADGMPVSGTATREVFANADVAEEVSSTSDVES